MLFNSFTFLIFFLFFFFFYWLVFHKRLKLQNLVLLTGSYVFYAWADWRFLFVLIAVSAFNFFLGIYIEKSTRCKRLLLYIGLIQNIGSLAFFKYYNFFITSFNGLFQSLNINLGLNTLNIVIPLGISFFTFRMISYILDIDKAKVKATKDWIVFFNYVSFFPAVLSGPIDKAKSFIPQLENERVFNYYEATDGLRQILWGLFKKIVIADNCEIFSSEIFDVRQAQTGSTLMVGAFFYTIQIYADFSGYSDMAIGFSRLIGFNITRNFDSPFFSQNIAEFWRRWHISLTAWCTEYIFTPLSIAFRDIGKTGTIMAILINFMIIGIWHGANWTYLLFGFFHGCYYIPLILKGTMNKKKRTASGKLFPSFYEFLNMTGTFVLIMITFILFKSEDVTHAFNYISEIFSDSLFTMPAVTGLISLKIILILFFIIEWFGRQEEYAIKIIAGIKLKYARIILYYGIILSILFLGNFSKNQFIYFQF